MRTYLGLIALGVALVMPAALRAQDQLAQTVLQIQGIVAASEDQAEKVGYDDVSMNFVDQPAKDLKWIGVVQATTEVGDPFEGKEILERSDGPAPTFLVSGKPDVVKVLRDAPVGARVTFKGMFIQESRNFLVSTASVLPPKK
jgi:hypothetical protein